MGGMTPGVRKFALTTHVTSSVGWLGSVAAFLAVALVALLNADELKVRGASTTMELIGWFVIVPFSAASCCPASSSHSELRGDCSVTIG